MIESVMFWNELNNPAHWFGGRPGVDGWRIEDAEWELGLEMVGEAARAVRSAYPEVERIFSGLSPMDGWFLERAHQAGALAAFEAVAGHNFWFDFGPASQHGESGLDGLAAKVEEMRTATAHSHGRPLPLILSEIGVSSFSGDALQAVATEQTLEVLGRIIERAPSTRATWYSLFDLPEEYLVTSLFDPESHGEVRHRKFGLYRWQDGAFRPKRAAASFARRPHPERIGITQWFRMPWPDKARGITPAVAHELSYRALEAAPPLLRELEVEWLRINVTWCDWHCAVAGELGSGLQWFDDLLDALGEFRLLVTVFQTPPQLARRPDAYAAGSVPRREHAAGFAAMLLEFLDRYRARLAARGAETRLRA